MVINADDYYGKEAFRNLYLQLEKMHSSDEKPMKLALAGFELKNTLSDFGSVNRGVCEVSGGKLTKISETYNIRRESDGKIHSGNDEHKLLDENSPVSMNMWACPAGFTKCSAITSLAFLSSTSATIRQNFCCRALSKA